MKILNWFGWNTYPKGIKILLGLIVGLSSVFALLAVGFEGEWVKICLSIILLLMSILALTFIFWLREIE